MMTLEPPRGVPEGAEGWRALGLSRAGLQGFARRAREAMGLRGEVDVLLTTDAVLKRLNRDFRGKDKATDVLSFPTPEEIAAEHAGDLAISVQTAVRQAKKFGHPLETELRVLMLHGFLHLSGMDHEADGGEMAAREADLRERLHLPIALIARVEGAGNREEGTGNRDQGSGNRGQGTGRRKKEVHAKRSARLVRKQSAGAR